ncbi:PspC domain-containing protein [Flavobacterium okayamense]|uniref:Phage shock protein C (PspC) family protein n=1 Tax=Flavobacterium okayamense TaxID=2830782 RepID=A0ABN6HZT0_9FLAO|nr:PspC domain-containing protein [Flavobacterium okayamense]BCY28502.1 hypothetical protein KK2020170_13700 [Flavobacterium okayamense]
MNKTISINLGGFFFHIDEDAYQKLTRYFDAVKRSLSPEGRDEIIKDIESRIAELFQERMKNETQVIGLTEIDEVISIMGQPEDYRIDEDNSYSSKSTFTTSTSRTRRLYRDRDNSILGGVAAGFGHYFGIDPLWVRILFIISPFISFGTSVLIYLILWILIPEAITTSQKLEMRGEAINISNIEKKVKEGIGEISEKINNIDHEKVANTAKSGANQIATTIGDLFLAIFRGIAKVMGVFIIIFAAMSLLGIIIGGIVMMFTSSMPDTFIFNHVNTPFEINMPLWLQGLLLILSVGIPLLFFLLLGFKLLISNMRPVGNYFKIALLGIWLISIITLAYFGIKQATEKGYEGKTVHREEIALLANDTLYVKMTYNDFFTKNVRNREHGKYTHDENNNEIIYSNNVRLHLMKSETENAHIQIEKTANGKSHIDAKSYAEKINYNFEIQGNRVNLDNYFTTDFKNKFRDQEVDIYLYLPEGIYFYPEESVSKFLTNSNSDISMYYGEEDNLYQLKSKDLDCLSCPAELIETENDSLNENVIIKVNDKEVNIKLEENSLNIQTK